MCKDCQCSNIKCNGALVANLDSFVRERKIDVSVFVRIHLHLCIPAPECSVQTEHSGPGMQWPAAATPILICSLIFEQSMVERHSSSQVHNPVIYRSVVRSHGDGGHLGFRAFAHVKTAIQML